MSPEWMMALARAQRMADRRPANGLSDPLEREEWKGLERVSDLFARLLGGRGGQPRKPSRRGVSGGAFARETAFRRN